MKRIRLTITQQDLDRSEAARYVKPRSMSCPIQQALVRRYGADGLITVGVEQASVHPKTEGRDFAPSLYFKLGKKAREFVTAVDGNRPGDYGYPKAGTVVILTDQYAE